MAQRIYAPAAQPAKRRCGPGPRVTLLALRGGLLDLPLFAELRRRRVFRALIGYAIAAFAVLQIIEPVMHGLHWPEAVLSYVVVALALGFPLVVFLAWIINTSLAQLRLYDRDYEGAGELLRKTLEMDPVFAPARGVLAELYILEGKYTEALAEAEKLAGGACSLELYRAFILAKAGRREEALALARDVERRARDEYVSLSNLGGLWIALGDKDKGFALLHTACETRDPGLLMLKLDPALDGMRSDPRYKQLLQCAGLD